MTCEELRWCFEENFRVSNMGSNQGDAAEHMSACAECSRFVEEQRVLARNLTSVRQLAGEVPGSVDAAIVARYRLFVGERERAVATVGFRPSLAWRVWAWGAAVAAVLAVTTFWVFGSKHAVTTVRTPTPAPAPTVTVPVAQVATPNPVAHAPGRNVANNVSTKSTAKHHGSRPAEAPVRVAKSLPEGFRSLMFCDALSCPDAMDMIRVQLPASAMPRQLPGFVQTSGSVTADVLVGPDGIARGIRFEEIEF
jgi:hypothetical protein